MIGPGKYNDLDTLLTIEHEAFQSDRISRGQMQKYLRNNGTTWFLLVGRSEENCHYPDCSCDTWAEGRTMMGKCGKPTCDGYILILMNKLHKAGRIHSYAIHSRARGTGLGERLIEFAADFGKQGYKLTALRTEVRADNPYALSRYEKSGFRRVGGKPSYYSDGCDSISFERAFA